MQNGQLFGGGGSPIKSIQYGEIDLNGVTNATATITAVVVANSVVIPMGLKSANGTDQSNVNKATLVITNTTTITATSTGNTAVSRIFRFCVIEFQPGILKSNQVGTIAIGTAVENTHTATISAVTVASTWLVHQGEMSAQNECDLDATKLTLTNTTTITADRSLANAGVVTVAYAALEFN